MALFFGFAGLSAQSAREFPVKTIVEEPFYVAGYSVRTNNAKEMSGEGQIGALWQRFMQGGLSKAIPNHVDGNILAVYSDYASDESGDYTYTLGVRVSSVDSLPQGVGWRRLAGGRYSVFITDRGPVVQVVQAEWKRIWAMQPSELGGRRAFHTDYEVYDARSANANLAQVEIHLGIASAAR
jgi:predicted transcriptional regulator YdeE